VRGVLAGVLAAALFVSSTANADSYSYGGEGERFRLGIWLIGFNEGAGSEGWSVESAREFAEWAARFDAIIPRGASVSLERDVNDTKTQLLIRVGKQSERHEIAEEPGFAEALRIVARRFHAKPPPARPTRIYTLQLFASKSEASARRFAESLETRQVRVEGPQFYHEACHPCSIPESKVLEGGGMYRVVTGVFADRPRASRALRVLQRRHALRGFVREL
jgi:hypothetical protein